MNCVRLFEVKRLAGVVTVCVALLGITAESHAVPLQALFDGQDLVVDDKVFSDWELQFLNFSAAGGPDFNLIDVQPLNDQPLNPGIRFVSNGQLAITDTDFIDLRFGFSVATLSGAALIKDNSLEMRDFSFGGAGGRITIDETIFDVSPAILGSKSVEAYPRFGIFNLVDVAEFALQSKIFVEKDIFIEGEFAGDTVSLNVFDQRFSQVPEPATAAMLCLGLAGLALLAWARKA